jgi:two-component sensor histidine kinase/GAF domain-containing protein
MAKQTTEPPEIGPAAPRCSCDALRIERDAAERAAARLSSVLRLARLVNSTLDSDRVCDFIAQSASHLLGDARVLLVVTDGGSLRLRSSAGLRRPDLRDQDEFRPGEGLIGWVFQHRMPLVVSNVLADARTMDRAWAEAEGLGPFAGVPLLVWGRCLGVLCVARSGDQPFAPADLDLLQSFAAHAATAVQNAQRYQEADAEAHRLRALIEAMPAAVALAEGTGDGRRFRLCMENRAWVELQGSPEQSAAEWLQADGTPLALGELPLQRAIRWREPTKEAELILRFPDGGQRHVLVNAVPLPGVGEIRQAVGMVLDITERRQAEEAMRRLAAEHAAVSRQAAHEARVKSLLLDELNHRVRNNLALIVSFLELQRATPDGERAAAVLEQAIARVKGLGLVHNVLNGEGFRAGQYETLVHRLADQTFRHGALQGRVALRVNKQPLCLSSDALTALGIVTNELFTNIAKHAFPDGRSGSVEVRVDVAAGDVALCIRDDGVGLQGGSSDGAGRLGLRLVRSLVEVSLQGTCTLQVDRGTAVCIRFPLPLAQDTAGIASEPAARSAA